MTPAYRFFAKRIVILIGFAAAIGPATYAAQKSAATLIREFNDLFKGRKARIVWMRDDGGWPGTGKGTNRLMRLNTEDGVVNEFIGTTNGYKARPTFTWDGEYVIFTDLNTGTIYKAKWSDKSVSAVIAGYENGGCYFFEGKHWVIANVKSPGAIWRINIFNPGEKVKLTDKQGIWPSISPDGQYLAGLWPGFGHAGVINLSTGSYKEFSDPAGCWPTMARDNSHNTLYTIEPHTNIRIVTPTESEVVNKRIVGLGGEGEEYNILRWTMDPDICTYMIDAENTNNPYVFRISDGKAVYIMQPESGAEGNMDIFFPGWTPPGTEPVTTVSSRMKTLRAVLGNAPAAQQFDLRGKLLNGPRQAGTGIRVIRHAGSHGQAAIVFAPIAK